MRVSTGGPSEAEVNGVILIVARPDRLRYTWRWDNSTEETIVDVRFHAAGEYTVVEVDHRGFQDVDSLETHRSGWTSYFQGLTNYL